MSILPSLPNPTNSPRDRIFGSATTAREDNQFGRNVTNWWLGGDEITLNWSGAYPFQLAVWDIAKGQIDNTILAPFTLPIPPQTLSIGTPFASTVEATMGGIVEANNGAPFRNIALQGTTGVLPLRGTTARGPDSSSLATIFGGTVNAIDNLITSTGLDTPPSNTVDASNSEVAKGSGFAQWLKLRSWLEYYADYKKRNAKSGVFLALCIWKEQAAYICTPLSFDTQRSASSPMEYNYSIVLKAWKRVKLQPDTKTGDQFDHPVVGRSPSVAAQLLNGLDRVRRVLENAKAVVQACKMDIESAIFVPMRQAVLATKDLANVGSAVIDFPADLASDLLGHSISSMGLEDYVKFFQDSASGTTAKYEQLQTQWEVFQHGAQEAFTPYSGPAGERGRTTFWNEYTSSMLNDADTRVKLIGMGLPQSLPKPIQDQVDAEIARARSLTRANYSAFRDATLAFLADYSSFVGAGDASFSRTYSQSTVGQGRTEPTDADWEIMGALSDLAQSYDALAASYTINRNVNLIDYVAGLASQSGIAFRVPKSKFLVPFPYGYTLEKLAEQYLDDPDRWIEIASLNGLRSPYVDEVGFTDPLLVNGAGSTVWVADSTKYYVGQPVWISSDLQAREQRRVVGIQRLSDTQSILSLSGDADLQKYATAAHAQLQAFLPDTVNSIQYIYIPSDTEPRDQDFQIRPVAGVDYYDPYVRLGGVDLLLTQSNDLVITPTGTRLAVGMTNIIQRARIALSTPKGLLMRHPEFGLGIKPGTSTANMNAAAMAAAAKTLFGNDPMFAGINFAKVTQNAGGATITLGLNINGTQQPVPITVDIRR